MDNVITFSGSNENLFTRHKVDVLSEKTTLIVPETHNAILIKDGQMLQTLSSGRYQIAEFVNIKTEANASLEVLFMSKTAKLNLLWGTATKILMFDPVLQENYHLGLSGDFDVQIGDPRKCYLYVVGASQDLTSSALQERLSTRVLAEVESVLVEYIETNNVVFNKLPLHKKEISMKVLPCINRKLMNEYGVAVFSFNIANSIIDDKDLQKLTNSFKQITKKENSVCSCGASLKENDKFCSECGRKLKK